MNYAVVFRVGITDQTAAGVLEFEQDRLCLRGRGNDGAHELEIPFADLYEVCIHRGPSERLKGYPTIVLKRTTAQAVEVAPLGALFLHEIADLLASVAQPNGGGEVLAVLVPLKPGCLDRARTLLAKGPPLDPGVLGLSGHEVYLDESKALFVFRGADVRTRVDKAMRHPAVWRAGLAWQRCFAGPPQIIDPAEHTVEGPPAYRWSTARPG
jgi:hypothetical protein